MSSRIVGLASIAMLAAAAPAAAQTDYYNTDAGRPLHVEDAYAVERRAVELQAAPLRVERSRTGMYAWGVEPELAVGVLPRTQFEVGLPLVLLDAGVGGWTAGVAGLDVKLLHNLNAETRIPALAVAAGVLAPVGRLAPEVTYASVKGIATRTLPWLRVHANAEYTFGDEPDATNQAAIAGEAADLARWTAGVAVDRVFPLKAFLVGAELFVQQPIAAHDDPVWNVAAGTRVQLTPRVAIDVGGGTRMGGHDAGWFATTGGAITLGLPWRARRAAR
jgi:hypothetical protein